MDTRPWGGFTVLEEQDAYKVKRIEVLSGKRLSYQKHDKRAEHWIVVQGQGVVTLEGREMPLSLGQSVDIPQGAAHRMFNPGKELLVFIEIQTGAYFGEDDITRIEDDFGRAEEK